MIKCFKITPGTQFEEYFFSSQFVIVASFNKLADAYNVYEKNINILYNLWYIASKLKDSFTKIIIRTSYFYNFFAIYTFRIIRTAFGTFKNLLANLIACLFFYYYLKFFSAYLSTVSYTCMYSVSVMIVIFTDKSIIR